MNLDGTLPAGLSPASTGSGTSSGLLPAGSGSGSSGGLLPASGSGSSGGLLPAKPSSGTATSDSKIPAISTLCGTMMCPGKCVMD